MQARFYDPNLGRFLSNDPVGFLESGLDPLYFNRYAYVGNDPINATDPDGRTTVYSTVRASTRNENFTAEQFDAAGIDAISTSAGVAADIAGGGIPSGEGLAVKAGVKTFLTGIAKKGAGKNADAAAVRAKNVEKGVPESQLGPSGKPKQHTVQHSSRKSANQAAKKEADRAGGKVRNDANPQNDKQGPHFQAEDAKGDNVKPVVHHERPD